MSIGMKREADLPACHYGQGGMEMETICRLSFPFLLRLALDLPSFVRGTEDPLCQISDTVLHPPLLFATRGPTLTGLPLQLRRKVRPVGKASMVMFSGLPTS
jgi:hypothetical protein